MHAEVSKHLYACLGSKFIYYVLTFCWIIFSTWTKQYILETLQCEKLRYEREGHNVSFDMTLFLCP